MRALWVVLPLPREVRGILTKAQGGLHVGKPVPPGWLNLPLAELGEQEDGVEDAVRAGLDDVAPGPFRVTIDGLGTLGGQTPHTLYAEVELSSGLKDLHTRIRGALRDAGITVAYQRWTPHVPLAYFDALGQHDLKQIMSFLSRRAGLSAGPFPVTDFELITPPSNPDASEPELVATWALSGRSR